jgi:hypothetical protein
MTLAQAQAFNEGVRAVLRIASTVANAIARADGYKDGIEPLFDRLLRRPTGEDPRGRPKCATKQSTSPLAFSPMARRTFWAYGSRPRKPGTCAFRKRPTANLGTAYKQNRRPAGDRSYGPGPYYYGPGPYYYGPAAVGAAVGGLERYRIRPPSEHRAGVRSSPIGGAPSGGRGKTGKPQSLGLYTTA